VIESDVIVIGAGVMGGATARVLASSGVSVTLIEQFHVGHTRGSSHGRSRIFRLSYSDEMYVAMAQESMSLWRRAEQDTGTTLLTVTGGIDIGVGIEANAEALRRCGACFSMVRGADAAERWPQLDLCDQSQVLFQHDAGILAADRAVKTFVASAVLAGARLHDHARVDSLAQDDGGVTAVAGDLSFRAPVAVVTAGAWAGPLLEGAGVTLDVVPTRETVAYFRHEGATPPTVVEWGSPAVYALASPGHGIKVGEHIAGPTADPDDEGHADETSIARVAAWVARRFIRAEPEPVEAETCLYTNTTDQHFVVERHGNVVVGSPCSGHGFKFAPLVGKRLATLAFDH
jgi:sarcosine oxidase